MILRIAIQRKANNLRPEFKRDGHSAADAKADAKAAEAANEQQEKENWLKHPKGVVLFEDTRLRETTQERVPTKKNNSLSAYGCRSL